MATIAEFGQYLESTPIVDWEHPQVKLHASSLADDCRLTTAKRCFDWVRDEVQHCMDFCRSEVTCKASDVLARRTGFCYAKSHLLAALLRANRIPAGFCYQRLALDGVGQPYCLHGLNAVWLAEFGWYRLDARGNKPGVDAQFMPPVERLAFPIACEGEFDIAGVFAEPMESVVAALTRFDNAQVLAANLPDIGNLQGDKSLQVKT